MSNDDTTDRQDLLEQVHSMMKDVDIAMVTTIQSADDDSNSAGSLISRPLSTQVADNGDALFLVRKSSAVIADITADPRVNLAYSSTTGWLSVAGTGAVVEDTELIKELWSPAAGAFMEGGPENPDNVLLLVTGDSAQLWGGKGAIGTISSVAKAIAGRNREQHSPKVVDLD